MPQLHSPRASNALFVYDFRYDFSGIVGGSMLHMGQYQLLSVLAARLSPLNIDHSGNLPVEICGINYTEKYTNL